jgi:site-specific DNA-methyltransferase (adenine-specific)
MEYLAAANRRQRAAAGGKAAGRGRPKPDSLPITPVGEKTPKNRKNESRSLVAAQYHISQRKVQTARRLQREAPRLYRRVKSGELRLAEAKREADRSAKRSRQRRLARQAAKYLSSERNWKITCGDCITEMQQMKAGTARLIFADSPYNIGINYGQGVKADQLTDKTYLKWCSKWMAACERLLTPDGSLWVMINDEYADHFGILLRNTGLHRRAWIKWYETFGVNCTKNFNRCSRHIFYCVKNPKDFVFNTEAITRPSDRQVKYADKRASPHGKIWDNVWSIPRLVDNSKERLPDFPTQLPLDLVRPIVQCASEPGDLVIDPFCGSGTTGVAASKSGRRFVGIEKNRRFVRAAETRLAS